MEKMSFKILLFSVFLFQADIVNAQWNFELNWTNITNRLINWFASVTTINLQPPTPLIENHIPYTDWDTFKVEYNRTFQNLEEEFQRRDIFQRNTELIQKHNEMADQGQFTFKLEQNKFTDMSQEKKAKYILFRGVPTFDDNSSTASPVSTSTGSNLEQPEAKKIRNYLMKTTTAATTRKGYYYYDDITYPTVDWRRQNIVTQVKNQGSCHSCASFAALGSLESQWAKKYQTLTNLSVQQVLDCGESNIAGCKEGAWMSDIFKYIVGNKGINSEACYGYTAQGSGCGGLLYSCHVYFSKLQDHEFFFYISQDSTKCNFKKSCVSANMSSWASITNGLEDDLKKIVTKIGPVSVAIGVDDKFNYYASGIYNNPNCTWNSDLHAVLVIGYGTDTTSGLDYWLIKNSWGTGWGQAGYGKIIRNAKNTCFIASFAAYPII